MQWETARPVGFPVCMRHNDCRLKKTAVKAEMKQHFADYQHQRGGRDAHFLRVLPRAPGWLRTPLRDTLMEIALRTVCSP